MCALALIPFQALLQICIVQLLWNGFSPTVCLKKWIKKLFQKRKNKHTSNFNQCETADSSGISELGGFDGCRRSREQLLLHEQDSFNVTNIIMVRGSNFTVYMDLTKSNFPDKMADLFLQLIMIWVYWHLIFQKQFCVLLLSLHAFKLFLICSSPPDFIFLLSHVRDFGLFLLSCNSHNTFVSAVLPN